MPEIEADEYPSMDNAPKSIKQEYNEYHEQQEERNEQRTIKEGN